MLSTSVAFFILGLIWQMECHPVNVHPTSNEDPIVLVHSIWRHGSRAPLKLFKNDPNTEENDWKGGLGNLLPNGMIQCMELGKKIRALYGKIIDPQYISSQVYIRSSDTNRTLRSATSNMIGLYGSTAQKGVDYPDAPDWPVGYVPVPIHTIAAETDDALFGFTPENCQRYKKAWEIVVKTPEYNSMLEKYQDVIKEAERITGEQFNFTQRDAAYYVVDEYFINRSLRKKETPGYTPELYSQLKEMNDLAIAYQYGLKFNDSPNGINLALEMSKPEGGPLLWEIIERMQFKAKCLEEKLNDKNQTIEAGCKWIRNLNYYAYSAHDSTITSLFTTFGFPETNWNRQGYPDYASCLLFELRKSAKTNEFYVKIIYTTESNTVDVTEHIKGCENGCSLDQFVDRSEPYRIENREKYCNSDPGT